MTEQTPTAAESIGLILETVQRLRVERDAARDIAVKLEQENAQLEKQRDNLQKVVRAVQGRIDAVIALRNAMLDELANAVTLKRIDAALMDSAVIKADSPYNDTSGTGE